MSQFERIVTHPSLALALADVAAPPATSTPSSLSQSTPPQASFDYHLHSKVGRGAYGELWKAVKLPAHASAHGPPETFVLKRLLVEKGEAVRASGWREVHFGQRLQWQAHVARFVECFELGGELWLVFRYEGLSLAAYNSRVEGGNGEGGVGRTVVSDEWRMLRMDMMTELERAEWRRQRRTEDDARQDGGDDAAADPDHHTVDLDVDEAPSLPAPSLTSPLPHPIRIPVLPGSQLVLTFHALRIPALLALLLL